MSAVMRGMLAALLATAFAAGTAAAQTETARPGRGPASETEAPSTAPPATISQTTGATGQNQVVKDMNEAEKAKIREKGK